MMPRAIAAFLLSAMIALSAALVRANGPRLTALYASPDGTDNGVCSQSMPCTAQSVLNACPVGGLCSLNLADGLYLDPAMNFYYHRTVGITGNCSNPSAVELRATIPGTKLVWVQDNAILSISCVKLAATSSGNTGVAGRQHVIVDMQDIVWGDFLQGVRIALDELSISSCAVTQQILGSAAVHVTVGNLSKYNDGCKTQIPSPVNRQW